MQDQLLTQEETIYRERKQREKKLKDLKKLTEEKRAQNERVERRVKGCGVFCPPGSDWLGVVPPRPILSPPGSCWPGERVACWPSWGQTKRVSLLCPTNLQGSLPGSLLGPIFALGQLQPGRAQQLPSWEGQGGGLSKAA